MLALMMEKGWEAQTKEYGRPLEARKGKKKKKKVFPIIVLLGCYQSATDWVAYKQKKFISHSSGGWNSMIRAPAWSDSGEDILGDADCQFLCPQMGKGLWSSVGPLLREH